MTLFPQLTFEKIPISINDKPRKAETDLLAMAFGPIGDAPAFPDSNVLKVQGLKPSGLALLKKTGKQVDRDPARCCHV